VERLDAELRYASQGARVRHETVLLRQGGVEIPVIVGATPMIEQGKLQGVLCVITDISEQKQMEQQLLQAEKLSALGELVAGVAHELNNPLTTVLGFAQLLKLEAADELKNDLEMISQAAERCARIVNNLLTFARQRKPGKLSVDLNQMINEVLNLKAQQLKLDNIEVSRELAPQLPWVVADPFQIQQVILNLVNNAQYAMAHANGGGHLLVRTSQSDGRVIIEVTDDGPGIPPDVMGRIFNPFFTTKGHDGTGLGLSVSYGIVRDHFGCIRVSSVPGRGASFYVELPIVTNPPVDAPQSVQPNGNRCGPGKRILVVDDEEYILSLVRRVLQTEKHQVEVAANGTIALELIARTNYDLILIDLRMPGINGRMLYERLREMRPELIQRVAFITGEIVSPDNQALIRHSGCPLLRKPFLLDELKQVVDKVLNDYGP
jgi:two-component system NtrC family sensor kinase